MATTTASKHGLRAAAAERTNKHAQRNPLPPKPGQVEDAKEAIAAAHQALREETQYGKMTVTELRTRAKELGAKAVSRLAKGELLNVILAAERAARAAAPKPEAPEPTVPPLVKDEAYYADLQAEQDMIAQDADSPGGAYEPDSGLSPEAVSAAAGGVIVEEGTRPATVSPTAAAGTNKGYAKAERLAEALAPYDWMTAEQAEHDGGELMVTYRRGDEQIQITWINGVFNYDRSAYLHADRVTRVRNVSQARQLAERTEEQARQELTRVASNKAWKRKEAPTEAVANLNFDPQLLTDAELIERLKGQKVKWLNRLSNTVQEGIVGRAGEQTASHRTIGKDGNRIQSPIRVTYTADQVRILNFNCPTGGARAFRVQDLLSATGGQPAKRRKAKATA